MKLGPRLPWEREPKSPRETEVYNFVVLFYDVNGRPPGVLETGRVLKISGPVVMKHYHALYRKGWLGYSARVKFNAIPLEPIER